MKIIEDRIENIKIDEKLCIGLGTFDGIHRGHKKIIETAISMANRKNVKSAILTFDRHPFSIIKPTEKINMITDNYVKARIVEALGVDYLIFLQFSADFANIDPILFIELLKKNLNACGIICGYNYTFGKYGKGNTSLLDTYKETLDYDLKVIKPVKYNNNIVSSTLIREELKSGNICDANAFLGYNYFCQGMVFRGKKLGRKLGFPTANIKIPENLCIKNGVYITYTKIDDKYYQSISNVGYNPTVESDKRSVETFIFDFKGDLYEKEIKVEFLDFIREEKKFPSVNHLKEQVLSDIEKVKLYFQSNYVYKV